VLEITRAQFAAGPTDADTGCTKGDFNVLRNRSISSQECFNVGDPYGNKALLRIRSLQRGS